MKSLSVLLLAAGLFVLLASPLSSALPVYDEEDDTLLESLLGGGNTPNHSFAPIWEDLEEQDDDSDFDTTSEDGEATALKTAPIAAAENEGIDINPACPTDPKVWGGPGNYCHGMDLVKCSEPGGIPDDVIRSCDAGCLINPPEISDECVSTPPHPVTASASATATVTKPFTATADFMKCIGVASNKAQEYATALTSTLAKFSITSREEIRSFLGNCAVESDRWKTTVEYGEKLCKGYTGGCTYKGRGFIQLTHDYTYKSAGKYFTQPFLDKPELVANQPWAFLTAGWFWTEFKRVRKCFDGTRSSLCAHKCAAAYINGYYKSDTDTCSIRDPNHWKERQEETSKVAVCIAKLEGTPIPAGPRYGSALNDVCGPLGEGKCGTKTSSMTTNDYWSGYCGSSPYYCIKPKKEQD